MKEVKKTQATLNDFSNILINLGFDDLFDFDIERDIFTSEAEGSFSDKEGDRVVEFTIIEKDGTDNMNTVIEYDENDSDLREV